MLTALILMAIFGGGSAEVFSRSDFRTVESAIEEPERADAATQAMERINDRFEALLYERDRYFQQLRDINASVESTEDEYNRVLDQLWIARREALASYTEEIFVLRDNMTGDEWETAFGKTDN
jgi:hypothetical protein